MIYRDDQVGYIVEDKDVETLVGEYGFVLSAINRPILSTRKLGKEEFGEFAAKEVAEKPKRKRRTKAEIEADKKKV